MTSVPLVDHQLPHRLIQALDQSIVVFEASEPQRVRYLNHRAQQLLRQSEQAVQGVSIWRLLSVVAPPFNLTPTETDLLTFSQAVQQCRPVHLVQSVMPRTQGGFTGRVMDLQLQPLPPQAGEPPLLLLDDVLAELDPERQLTLLEAVGDRHQCLVSATHLEAFEGQWRSRSQVVDAETLKPEANVR